MKRVSLNIMKFLRYIVYGLTPLFFLAIIFLGTKAYNEAIVYEDTTTQMVTLQTASEQAKLKLEGWAKTLLRGLYTDERKIHLDELTQKKEIAMKKAQTYTIYFMALLLLLLLISSIVSLRYLTIIGSLGAMITLFFGLLTPILMVTIHKEVDYIGDVVLSFESKGVIGSIEKLFAGGDNTVAIVILLFSVVVPIFKILSLFFIAIFMKSGFAHKVVLFLKMIGKWSMVDVFVVAVFLVYLTANKGDVSKAEVEVGLYFFLAYVIVSMLVSLSADKMLQRESLFK